ncbi:UNVERIFIED_CONTAM: hypothetical protein Sindi_2265800 [Sesamum indicum]
MVTLEDNRRAGKVGVDPPTGAREAPTTICRGSLLLGTSAIFGIKGVWWRVLPVFIEEDFLHARVQGGQPNEKSLHPRRKNWDLVDRDPSYSSQQQTLEKKGGLFTHVVSYLGEESRSSCKSIPLWAPRSFWLGLEGPRIGLPYWTE